MFKNNFSQLKACCLDFGEQIYQQHLQETQSRDSLILRQLLEWQVGIYGKYLFLFPYILRVANMPRFVNAFSVLKKCKVCSQQFAILIIGSNLLLLTWRLQMIYVSMIESWSTNFDGVKTKNRVTTRMPTEAQLHQADLAVKHYLKGDKVTDEGLDELVDVVYGRSKLALEYLIDAVHIGQLWIVGHEAAHPLIDLLERLPKLKETLAPMDAFYNAADNFVSHFNLTPKYHQCWVNESAADLFSTYFLLLGLCENQQNSMRNIPKDYNNEMAAMKLLAGIGAACESLYFASRLAQIPSNYDPKKTAHPHLHIRFSLISKYVRQVIQLTGEYDILSLANLIAEISKSFYSTWENKNTS